MINDDIAKQEAGDGSELYQSKGKLNVDKSIHLHGCSAIEVMRVAQEIFDLNFPKLVNDATKIVDERASKLFLDLLKHPKVNIEILKEKLKEPAIQVVLFEAQKHYAKSGDDNLKDILIEIISERIKCEERSLEEIVLDEAISTVAKLTSDQISIVTLLYAAREKQFDEICIVNINRLMNELIIPLSEDVFANSFIEEFHNEEARRSTDHLEYVGCVSSFDKCDDFDKLLVFHYEGLFSNGFTEDDLLSVCKDIQKWQESLCKSILSDDKLQFNDIQFFELNLSLHSLFFTGKNKDMYNKIISLYNKTLMTEDERNTFLTDICPKYKNFRDHWAKTSLGFMRLTLIGKAIAQANFRYKYSNVFKVG